jgi:hypothetical protein
MVRHCLHAKLRLCRYDGSLVIGNVPEANDIYRCFDDLLPQNFSTREGTPNVRIVP